MAMRDMMDDLFGFMEFVFVIVAFIPMLIICLIVLSVRNTIFITSWFVNWLRTPLNYR